MIRGTGFLFGRAAADRVKAAVLKSEAPEGKAGGPAGTGVLWNPGTVDAIVTTAITPAVMTLYGTGQAQIYIDDGGDSATIDTAYPDPVDVLNWSQNSGTIVVGTHIQISWRNGRWRFSGGDC